MVLMRIPMLFERVVGFIVRKLIDLKGKEKWF